MEIGDSTRYKTFERIYALNNEVYDFVWDGVCEVDLLNGIWENLFPSINASTREVPDSILLGSGYNNF